MATIESKELDQLMLRAAAGDSGAFRSFYDLCAPAVLAFLIKMLRDRHEAEDVLQESMVVAWHRAGEFDPDMAAAKTWITTIARRRALDILRRRQRQDRLLEFEQADIRAALGKDEQAPADPPLTRATSERLDHCFDQIGSDAATCIRYAYVYGLSTAEIASQLDRALGTVKSWIRRGLKNLKACMER